MELIYTRRSCCHLGIGVIWIYEQNKILLKKNNFNIRAVFSFIV